MSRREAIGLLALLLTAAGHASADGLVINEIMPANIDCFMDPSYNYGGWIELYNPSDAPFPLAGCYVTDNPDVPRHYHLPKKTSAVPAGGFVTLWFDHHDYYAQQQIDFSLDVDGGTICLFDAQGGLITQADYPAAFTRCSYARRNDGGEQWGWTSAPTPEASNAGSADDTFADEQWDAPKPDCDMQLFRSGQTMTFHVAIPDGGELHYTTDGTAPKSSSRRNMSGTFTTTQTTLYRFRIFGPGKLPSAVVTRSFIRTTHDYHLPVLSVVGRNADLYSNDYGIFGRGDHGRAGNGQNDKCNFNMDWDRPVNMELLDADGTLIVNQEVNMCATGAWSRASTPHSFKLKANKQYEQQNYIPYAFKAKPYNRNKSLQIRNGGNDNSCRIKDAAVQTIIQRSGIDLDCQSYQPVHHFVNGTYLGVINMREPNNKHFALANFGYDDDEIDLFEISPDSNYVQSCGTREAFDRLMTLSQHADDPDAYDAIRHLLDIDEYCNYMAAEFFLGGTDWPENNVKAYRPRTDDGCFRFVTYDLDFAYNTTSPFSNFVSKQYHVFARLLSGPRAGQTLNQEIKVVTLFLNLLRNDDFRQQFRDAYCLMAGSVFDPDRSRAILDELTAIVRPEMQLNGESPDGTANDMRGHMTDSRRNAMFDALQSFGDMHLSSAPHADVTITASTPDARLTLNGLTIPYASYTGRLYPPVTLTAEAPAGYRFCGWYSHSLLSRSLFPRSTSWKYYDRGSLNGKGWQQPAYDDASWSSGRAPLAFNSSGSGYATRLDYGSDSNNKRPTYYFRRTFTLDAAPLSTDIYRLSYVVDDGFVVYVNGTEAGRVLMNSGTPSYSTYSSAYYADPEAGTLDIDPALLHEGDNVIAVEVHNCSGSSSDIWWDASLSRLYLPSSSEVAAEALLSADPDYTFTGTDAADIYALFEVSNDYGGPSRCPLRINEVSAANDVFADEHGKKGDWLELYNASAEPYPLAGLWLSNDSLQPHLFQLPADAGMVPAHGHRIVWCDRLSSDSQLHATFKLSASGGCVLLSDADSLLDAFDYCPHAGHESVGLWPDGGSRTFVMQRATPDATNIHNSADADWEQSLDALLTGIAPITLPHPSQRAEGAISVVLDGSDLVIRANVPTAIVTVCDLHGIVRHTVTATLRDGTARIALGNVGSGIFVLRITTPDSATVHSLRVYLP